MPQPTSGEPVNVIIATSGCSTSALPTVPPPPVTTLSQPGGQPALVEQDLGEEQRR